MSKNYWKDQEGKRWWDDAAVRATLVALGVALVFIIYYKFVF